MENENDYTDNVLSSVIHRELLALSVEELKQVKEVLNFSMRLNGDRVAVLAKINKIFYYKIDVINTLYLLQQINPALYSNWIKHLKSPKKYKQPELKE